MKIVSAAKVDDALMAWLEQASQEDYMKVLNAAFPGANFQIDDGGSLIMDDDYHLIEPKSD